jgi:four helix bundle protein
MGDFQKLNVWVSSKNLAVSIYQITMQEQFRKDYGFKDQFQRAAVSIPSNIAEGDESGSSRLSIRHFYIAKGSAAELMTQLIIASEIGYISNDIKEDMVDQCDKISSMLTNLIKARSRF